MPKEQTIYSSEGRKNMARIETVKQHDLKDCGACSLLCIIKYYQGYVPLEKIRDDTCTNINGTTAYHLIRAARIYGFEALGVKTKNINDKNIYLPAIVHLNLKNGLQHFAVIYKINKNTIWLMDPARGKIKMNKEEFLAIWDNIIILLSPINNIVNYDKEVTILTLYISLLKKNKPLIIVICIVSLILMILSIISNFYFQLAISSLESGTDKTLLKFIILFFFNILFIKVILNHVKNSYLNYLSKNLDIDIFTNFLSHIFNIPLSVIENRTTGEITSRVQELREINNFLNEIFISVLMNAILITGAIVVLFFISAKLLLILCLVISIYIIIELIFNKSIYRKIKENIEVTTEFNSNLVENIEMNTSIKNLNLTQNFIWKLEDKLILMLKSNFEFQNLINKLEFLKNFIYEIGLFLVTTFGIYLIYKGYLEMLSLVTFNSIIIYLFEPIKELMELIPKYNYLKVSFNKISEFLNIKREDQNEKGLKSLNNNAISLRNIKYSYNKFTNILNNLNMNINPGDKVLLLGSSGSGKSTICKLLYRFFNIDSGIIELDNTSEKDYSLDAIRENILYIGQNENLFTGTIKDNIICFRDVLDDEFLKIAKICKLEEIVNKRPNRYNSVINSSYNNLSGGERQRIILARGLLKKSKIIILDEALSEVNEQMERDIIKNIFETYPHNTLIYVTHKNVLDLFKCVINMEKING